MTRCWRCGGGKTITMTTTGSHALPCPTCGGAGELTVTQEDDRKMVADVAHPALEPLRTGPKAA